MASLYCMKQARLMYIDTELDYCCKCEHNAFVLNYKRGLKQPDAAALEDLGSHILSNLEHRVEFKQS